MSTLKYGPALEDLLAQDRLMALGPGEPDRAAYVALSKLTVDAAFDGYRIADRLMAEACLSGVWLYHDYLDESHQISQSIDTPTGSYWHGIMHRREPDCANAKYWFRRVGRHPVFDLLGRQAEVGDVGASWDPFKFVDVCEAQRGSGTETERRCRRTQMLEWRLLFDYCFRQAIGQ